MNTFLHETVGIQIGGREKVSLDFFYVCVCTCTRICMCVSIMFIYKHISHKRTYDIFYV